MANKTFITVWDILLIILKNKKRLIGIFFVSMITSYLILYFFVEKQYEASATIIPLNDNSLSGLSSLFNTMSSKLPMGLGNLKTESDMNLYFTILFSRTFIEKFMNEFKIQDLYKIKSREKAVKFTLKIIDAKITLLNTFTIKVRTLSPQLAADMTNYLIKNLNEEILDLNISKSRANRQFLEKRYHEISVNLRGAEDSLRYFQENTGIFQAENQMKSSLEAFAKLDADLATKQVEVQVLNQMYGSNSPNVKSARIGLEVLKNKISKMKSSPDSGSILISLNSIPEKSLEYFRLYRNVKIYNEMLTYILPMYEQAKFDEQKDVPILQIIDNAVPPEKKVYPSRLKLSVIFTFITLLLSMSIFVLKNIFNNIDNDSFKLIKKELFNFK